MIGYPNSYKTYYLQLKMKAIKELAPQSYNFIEKTFIYAGVFAGAVAPIVASRYYLFDGSNNKEAWILSLIVNALPVVAYPHLPLPILTGEAGRYVASKIVSDRRKSIKKNGLEKKF